MPHVRRSAWFLALTLVSVGTARGTDVPIQNPSFETPAIPAGTFATSAPPPPGWEVYGNGVDFGLRTVGVLDPTGTTLYPDGAPHGENVGVVFLLDNFGNQGMFAGIEAGLQQTLAATLETDTAYTVTVEVGNIGSDATPPHDPFQFDGFPGYRVDLLAGGIPIGSDANSLLPPEGEFLTTTFSVVVGASHARAGEALGVRLVNLNSAAGIEVNFDDVRLAREPAASGAVPDGDTVPGAPLLLAKTGAGDVTLSWSPSCFAGDTDYAVYAGSLGDFASHVPVGTPACTTSGMTSLTLTAGGATRYFLVVPQGGAHEGSYGYDSAGDPRPASLAACRTQLLAVCH